MPGMQILVRPCQSHLQIGHSPHSAIDRRHLVGDHCSVRNEDHIGSQPLLVLLHPSRKGWTADLLLPLEDELHVMAKFAATEEIFKSLDVHKELALVIIGPSGVNRLLTGRILLDHRFERISVPFLKRFRRLHVIVAVNQHGLPLRVYDLLAEHHGVALARINSGLVGTRLQKQLLQPLGATFHILLVVLLRADGRNPQEREQLLKEPFPVFLNIFLHSFAFFAFHKNSQNLP